MCADSRVPQKYKTKAKKNIYPINPRKEFHMVDFPSLYFQCLKLLLLFLILNSIIFSLKTPL